MKSTNKTGFANPPLVSVIVPIYNVEKYLKECLDSIINQTYKNLEIILVDDKSPDSSGKIADEYAKKDKRIKVIHKKKNEGLNMARATGFKHSKGVYITFVDSDDMISRECLDECVQVLVGEYVDFVRFGSLSFKDAADLSKKINEYSSDNSITRINNKADLYKTQFNGLPGIYMLMCVWGAVYSRKVIEPIDWLSSNYRAFEDNIWTLRMLENANSAVYMHKVGHLYRYDTSIANVLSKSIMGNSFNGKQVGYLEYVDILKKEYREYNDRYKLKADGQINIFANGQWLHRLKMLVANDAIQLENNLKFLPTAIESLLIGVELVNQQKNKDEQIISSLRQELKSFLGIKRSAKLLLGNIKRKIVKTFV